MTASLTQRSKAAIPLPASLCQSLAAPECPRGAESNCENRWASCIELSVPLLPDANLDKSRLRSKTGLLSGLLQKLPIASWTLMSAEMSQHAAEAKPATTATIFAILWPPGELHLLNTRTVAPPLTPSQAKSPSTILGPLLTRCCRRRYSSNQTKRLLATTCTRSRACLDRREPQGAAPSPSPSGPAPC
jgi:hypothetical protein